MITLQTPGTGFDDFESKIALGLCRIALDCVEPEKVTLEESFDRYLVHINTDEDQEIKDALSLWIISIISSEDFLQKIPCTRPKEIYDGWNTYKKTGKKVKRKGHASKLAELGIQTKAGTLRISDLYNPDVSREPRKGSHDSVCGHKIEKILGAILAFSSQLGSPPIRNNPARSTEPPDICPYCAALGFIGISSFQIEITISKEGRWTKERYFFIPRFRGVIKGDVLSSYIAAIKNIKPTLNSIPVNSTLLALLSLHPHAGRIIQKHHHEKTLPSFFIARADTSGNAPRFQYFKERNVDTELMFLGDNPYNVALSQNAYRMADTKPEVIGLLSNALQFKQNQDAVSFCREYVSVKEGKQLIYKESIKYIAKEVLGMDEKLIDDPNIGAIASMLRFFVSKQKFGYVDNLRGSRTPEEFEKHLLSAQRDAASIYSKPNDKKDREEKWLFLPNENNIREVLKLLEKNFEQVKTLTCLLSFSYWKKEE